MSRFVLADGEPFDLKRYLRTPPRQRQSIWCDVCRQEMRLCAEHATHRIPHPRHPHNSGCPTIPGRAIAYARLHARHLDPHQRAAMVTFVRDHLGPIARACRTFADGMLYRDEFDLALIQASQMHVWAYRDLPQSHIPAVLASLLPVYAAHQHRPIPFHLVLDPQVAAWDDLWIHGRVRQQVWRIYHDGYSNDVVIPISADWLREPWQPTPAFGYAERRLLDCVW
jgi:hypothetical protein